MGVDHLGEVGLKQEIQRLWSAVRKVSRATLQNGSIGRAGIRVYDGGWIRIEDGGLSVTGTQTVTGTLTGSGTFDWTGPMNLKGAQSITGPTTFTGQMTVNGPWKFVGNGEITGTVDLKGILRLLSDLLVKAGGRIVVEGSDQIVLEQAGGVARIGLGASEIRGGSGIGLYPNNGPSIISTAAGLRIFPLPTISSATAGLPPKSLYIDDLGFVKRVV